MRHWPYRTRSNSMCKRTSFHEQVQNSRQSILCSCCWTVCCCCRPSQALSEFSRPDRATFMGVQDKLSVNRKQSYIEKVLQSYDPERRGVLTREAMRAALDRLHLGLSDENKEKVRAGHVWCVGHFFKAGASSLLGLRCRLCGWHDRHLSEQSSRRVHHGICTWAHTCQPRARHGDDDDEGVL